MEDVLLEAGKVFLGWNKQRAQGLEVLLAQSLAPLSIAPALDKYFTELAVGAKKQETFSDLLLSRAVNI